MVKQTLQQTKATVEEFGRYFDIFKANPPRKEGTDTIASWMRRIVWSLSGVKKTKCFRDSMQRYSAILTLTLQLFNKFVLCLRR